MRRSLVLLVLVFAGSVARADEVSVPPASCFEHPERWSYDRAKEPIAAPGERFLDDMQRCAPTLASNIIDHVRYKIQDDETNKFLRQKDFVLWAYAIAWAVLAAAGLAVYLRQQRLVGELRDLEERLRQAQDPDKDGRR